MNIIRGDGKLLPDCKKRLKILKYINLASTFALQAVSSTTDKNHKIINKEDNLDNKTFTFHNRAPLLSPAENWFVACWLPIHSTQGHLRSFL